MAQAVEEKYSGSPTQASRLLVSWHFFHKRLSAVVGCMPEQTMNRTGRSILLSLLSHHRVMARTRNATNQGVVRILYALLGHESQGKEPGGNVEKSDWLREGPAIPPL